MPGTRDPHHDRVGPIFERIVLFPLRILQRTRGWRRLLLLALYGVVILVTWALLWRRSQLRGLPDVGDPFTGPAFRSTGPVDDDRNAFVPYLQAAGEYREMTDAEGDSFGKADLDWADADPILRSWVDENHKAIALLVAGSKRPESALSLPESPTGLPAAAEKNQILVRLSWVGTAALFEAGRRRIEGDRVGAWEHLQATVLAARHMAQAAPSGSGRVTAMILTQYAWKPIAQWAEDPAVDILQLEHALNDVVRARSLMPPLSAAYREQYRDCEESLANLGPFLARRVEEKPRTSRLDLLDYAPQLDAYLRGEPERSRRVLRLLAANDLAWCDRPATERPALAVPRLKLYAADPTAPPASRALPPQVLAEWVDSALIAYTMKWRTHDLEHWDKTDRWSLGRLEEAIAVPLFTRATGRPPASPAEALRHYHPSPGDHPVRDEAEPLPALHAP